MENTLKAVKYGISTLGITPKEMFSLIESSKDYTGEEYNRWLANEIIKVCEKDGVGYSNLLVKWFNIITSISDEYKSEDIVEIYNNFIKSKLVGEVYTLGFDEDNEYGTSVDDIDWESNIDMPYNLDFIDNIDESISIVLKETKECTFFIHLKSKKGIKKNTDIFVDAKQNGVILTSIDSVYLYRLCSIVNALEDASNINVVLLGSADFFYSSSNVSLLNYFLMFFKYKGVVIQSPDLFENSFTNENFIFLFCSPRTSQDDIQNGIVLKTLKVKDDKLVLNSKVHRFSKGSNMLENLYKDYSDFPDIVPLVDREGNPVGETEGDKNAFGYGCKAFLDRNLILSDYPIENTKYFKITKDNLIDVIGYFGISTALVNAGGIFNVNDLITGHVEYKNFVYNCVPLFLYDVNSLFRGLNTEIEGIALRKGSKLLEGLIESSSVYYSFESKELVGVVEDIKREYSEKISKDFGNKTINELREELNNPELSKKYFDNILRCQRFIMNLYDSINI